jgi:ubiquinone/menaquinone biosynthesis C-methylase UbiE
MAKKIDHLIYRAKQGVRTAWYTAHYAAAAQLTPKLGQPPVGQLPGLQTIYGDLEALLRQDWCNIQNGLYPAPELRSSIFLRAARRSVSFFRDLRIVNRRRIEANGNEVFNPELGAHYPGYYLQNFHYQSGGYLTADSAELYDHQVEVLFIGGADAMRRQAIGALSQHLRAHPIDETGHLDIACGTGRFLEMLKEAHPRMRVTGIDLSHPYLMAAKRLLKPWSRAGFLQANAEAFPFPDNSFGSLSCVFLFHELPENIRTAVAKEIARVLRPGGQLYFLDSMQLGDQPDYDILLERFPLAFHEPYYLDFIRTDLTHLFKKVGLSVKQSDQKFFAKLLVVEKP